MSSPGTLCEFFHPLSENFLLIELKYKDCVVATIIRHTRSPCANLVALEYPGNVRKGQNYMGSNFWWFPSASSPWSFAGMSCRILKTWIVARNFRWFSLKTIIRLYLIFISNLFSLIGCFFISISKMCVTQKY